MVNRPITSSRVKRLPMLSLSSFSISCMANVHKKTALVGGLVFVFDGLAFIYPIRHIGRQVDALLSQGFGQFEYRVDLVRNGRVLGGPQRAVRLFMLEDRKSTRLNSSP